MRILIILSVMVSNLAFGIGELEIPSEKRIQLESEIKKGLGITKAKAVQYRLGRENFSSLDFEFGTLDETGFKKIRSYFSFKLNPDILKAPFDARRKYRLSDFLLPKMQAPLKLTLEGRDEIRGLEKLTGSRLIRIAPETNCWSTGYDILRSAEEPFTSYIYVPSGDDVTTLLKDEAFSKSVSSSELRPYDYVMYFSRQSGKLVLDHVAISLGMGLVYEKTGNLGMMDFYQIQPLKDVTEMRKDLNGGSIKVEYRRLIKSLPHPYSVWSAKAKKELGPSELDLIPVHLRDQIALTGDPKDPESYQLIRPLKIVADSKGNYRFDPADKLSRSFHTSSIVGFIVDQEYGYADSKLQTKACRINGDLNVKVLKADGQNFFVETTNYQLDPDNLAMCRDPAGKEVKKFWVPPTISE